MRELERPPDTGKLEPTMPGSHLQKLICQAVSVAFLLSGDLETAENVVADAIQSLDAEDLSTDALFVCVSTLSMQRTHNAADRTAQSKPGDRLFPLPPELQNVLNLPRLPRFCFVLRFLLGLPVSTSACVLQLERYQVIDYSSEAVSILAAKSTREVSHEAKWLHINHTSTNEDEQADFGMDALDLHGTRESIEREAVKAFGPSVTNFSRERFAPTPTGD